MNTKQQRVCLIVAALFGIVGLIQFGDFVLKQNAKQGAGAGIIVRAEIRTLVASQALIDFSKRQNLSTIASREELICLLECEGLQKSWYGITVRSFQANGQSQDSSGVGSLTEPAFRHTLAVLRTLAGRPPRMAAMDFTPARIVVIPQRLEHAEPEEVFEHLSMQVEDVGAASSDSGR